MIWGRRYWKKRSIMTIFDAWIWGCAYFALYIKVFTDDPNCVRVWGEGGVCVNKCCVWELTLFNDDEV